MMPHCFSGEDLKYDLSRKGVEELTKPTLAEGILMDILRTAETGTTVVQEVETKLVDLENRAKPAMIVDYEEDEKEVPSSHQREKKKEKKISRQPKSQSQKAHQRQRKKRKSLRLRKCQRQRRCQSSRKRARKKMMTARWR